MEGQNKHLGRILMRMSLEEISHLRQGLAAFVRAAEECQKEFNSDQTDPSS
jgi:hypothetical protein